MSGIGVHTQVKGVLCYLSSPRKFKFALVLTPVQR